MRRSARSGRGRCFLLSAVGAQLDPDVGEDGEMGHAQRVALGVAAACAGCGDNIEDPFVALVRVSGETPFTEACGGPQVNGRVFPSVEVEPSVGDRSDERAARGRRVAAGSLVDRRRRTAIGVAASFDGGATWTTDHAAARRV